MNRMVPINSEKEIFPHYHNTPVGRLLKYHNLGYPFDEYEKAQLLIGMCMDNRHQLKIPNNFAYILRTGGGNLRPAEFKISYAVSVGQVSHIALIGHSNCGMVNLYARREQFINGLVTNAGWDRDYAEEHFNNFAPIFEIGNEIDFLLCETRRIRQRYPKITVAPLYYRIEDNRLYQLDETNSSL